MTAAASHRHVLGWSERQGVEAFEHEHERGDEPHEHVLRDGGTEVKRTTWGLAPQPRVLPCCDGRNFHGHTGCVWPTGKGEPAVECAWRCVDCAS